MAKRRTPPRKQRPPALPSSPRVEAGPDGYDYAVRPIAAPRATKTYRCPGCDHEIKVGVAHVVVWPADSGEAAIDDRRHWHTACWANRRSPTRRWS